MLRAEPRQSVGRNRSSREQSGEARGAMRALFTIAALLCSSPGLAQPLLEAPRAATLGAPTTLGRGALLMGTGLLALAAGGAVSVGVGAIWIDEHFRVSGRPAPRIFSANIALALAVNMALTWLLLPDLARVTDDEGGTASVSYVRAETMRVTRWFALAGALFVGVLMVGSVLESNDFGRGQAVMAVGAGGAVLSALTFDVMSLMTVRKGNPSPGTASISPMEPSAARPDAFEPRSPKGRWRL